MTGRLRAVFDGGEKSGHSWNTGSVARLGTDHSIGKTGVQLYPFTGEGSPQPSVSSARVSEASDTSKSSELNRIVTNPATRMAFETSLAKSRELSRRAGLAMPSIEQIIEASVDFARLTEAYEQELALVFAPILPLEPLSPEGSTSRIPSWRAILGQLADDRTIPGNPLGHPFHEIPLPGDDPGLWVYTPIYSRSQQIFEQEVEEILRNQGIHGVEHEGLIWTFGAVLITPQPQHPGQSWEEAEQQLEGESRQFPSISQLLTLQATRILAGEALAMADPDNIPRLPDFEFREHAIDTRFSIGTTRAPVSICLDATTNEHGAPALNLRTGHRITYEKYNGSHSASIIVGWREENSGSKEHGCGQLAVCCLDDDMPNSAAGVDIRGVVYG